MRVRFVWLAGATVAVLICRAVLAGGDERYPADDKEAKNWHIITEDERVSVSVERARHHLHSASQMRLV